MVVLGVAIPPETVMTLMLLLKKSWRHSTCWNRASFPWQWEMSTGANDLIELLEKSCTELNSPCLAFGRHHHASVMRSSNAREDGRFHPGFVCIGMSRKEAIPVPPEKSSSRTLLSPFCDTCTWSLLVLVMTCVERHPPQYLLTKCSGSFLSNTASYRIEPFGLIDHRLIFIGPHIVRIVHVA